CIAPEDRAGWSRLRPEPQKKSSTARLMAKLSSASMRDSGNSNINAKLMSGHRVAEQEKFDTTHAKTVTQDMDPRTKQITETVDYTDLQADAEQIDVEPDFEM